jgi:hypothetical protein
MEEQSFWKILVEYLWIPTLTVVGALVAVIRQSDLHRIQALEKVVKGLATKDEVRSIESLAARAVQDDRFKEYVDRIEVARLEAKELLSTMLSEIKSAQQRTDDKLSVLTERVIATGLALDQRKQPR